MGMWSNKNNDRGYLSQDRITLTHISTCRGSLSVFSSVLILDFCYLNSD